MQTNVTDWSLLSHAEISNQDSIIFLSHHIWPKLQKCCQSRAEPVEESTGRIHMKIRVASYMSHMLLSKTKDKNKPLSSFLRLLEQKFKFHYYHSWCDIFWYTSWIQKWDKKEQKPIEISKARYRTSGRGGKFSLQISRWNCTLHSYRTS